MSPETISKYKLIFVGDNGVGKTALIQQYFHESFDKHVASTIACDYKIRNIKLKWEDQQHKAEEEDEE